MQVPFLGGRSDGNSRQARRAGSLQTTTWARRADGGLWVGNDRSVWMYGQLEMTPTQWEDLPARLEVGHRLESLLLDIGGTARDIAGNARFGVRRRQIHIFAATYEQPCEPSPAASPQHRAYLERVLFSTTAAKCLLVGVKLWSSTASQVAATGAAGAVAHMKALVNAGGESEDGLDAFRESQDLVRTMFNRDGRAKIPSPQAMAQLESWFNLGRGADVAISFTDTDMHVAGVGAYEISAVREFVNEQMRSGTSQWLLDAMTHPAGACAVSIRVDAEPATVTRSRLRQTQRRREDQRREVAETGDLERGEISDALEFGASLEEFVRTGNEPWLTAGSVLFARKRTDAHDTFVDMLRSNYDIHVLPLVKRQREGLAEMMPCAPFRANPFLQDFNAAIIGYAGLAGFSDIGDGSGLVLGSSDPDNGPVFIDPFYASKHDKPPVMAVFGDPGSGKTMTAQLLAGQAALAGHRVIMINPKGYESLGPRVGKWVTDNGGQAQVVSMRDVETGGGALDPNRFCPPQMAAEMLSRHILTVLGTNTSGALDARQEIELGRGLTEGALRGARCAFEMLEYVRDPLIVELVKAKVEASTLFALAFAKTPQPAWGAEGGLTLIEFDREMALPTVNKDRYEAEELVSLAALRLVTRASMEILMNAGGGVLIVDEAHHYLNSPEGVASLDRLAREGRSQGLLPIFLTQKPSDLLQHDMEMFMSRVLVMRMDHPDEAEAALTLCHLEPTASRLALLREASARPSSEGVPGRGALGFFRDPQGRHNLVMIGPVPGDVLKALSTSRQEDVPPVDNTEARAAGSEG